MTLLRFSTLLAPALAGLLAGTPWRAEAGCTQKADGNPVRKSLSLATKCNDKKLRSGPGATCRQATPPACSETLVGDAVALAYGPNDPPTSGVDHKSLRGQLACQKQIGKGVSSYVATKLSGLLKGQPAAEAEAKARRQLDKLPTKCTVTVVQDTSGVVLPAVGPQCAAAIGTPGSSVNASALRDCLLTLGGVWVDRFGPNPQPLRPNILFILTDDQRWDSTDATHSPSGSFIMPRLHAELGDSGVRFTNAFMTTPLCCPSRSSILTGQYAHRHGVYSNGGVNGGADDFVDTSTLGTWLQAAGYRTGFIGKYLNGYNGLWTNPNPPYVPPGWSEWHVFKAPNYFSYTLIRNGVGFDHVQETHGTAPSEYSTDVLREIARTFITTSVGMGQPFYLQVNFKAPHLPRVPAPRHEGKFADLPPWRPPSYNEPDVSDKPTWVQNLAGVDDADTDDLRIKQLEMVQAVDEAIGGSTEFGITGLMQTLRDLGIADKTIVVYFADNGYQWGEHRATAKNKPYEESIRAPMFVRYPPLAPLPRTETKIALNIDLASTFAELAGAAVPLTQDGTSLVRRIDHTAPAWRTDFLTEGWPGNHVWATVREDQWKYTELPNTPGSATTTFQLELYDLVADPYELNNVASDPGNAARIAAMAARLRQLRPNWPLDSDSTVELPED
ncbi:MAG: sulfatase [Candidatus Binatia bacterium]